MVTYNRGSAAGADEVTLGVGCPQVWVSLSFAHLAGGQQRPQRPNQAAPLTDIRGSRLRFWRAHIGRRVRQRDYCMRDDHTGVAGSPIGHPAG